MTHSHDASLHYQLIRFDLNLKTKRGSLLLNEIQIRQVGRLTARLNVFQKFIELIIYLLYFILFLLFIYIIYFYLFNLFFIFYFFISRIFRGSLPRSKFDERKN